MVQQSVWPYQHFSFFRLQILVMHRQSWRILTDQTLNERTPLRKQRVPQTDVSVVSRVSSGCYQTWRADEHKVTRHFRVTLEALCIHTHTYAHINTIQRTEEWRWSKHRSNVSIIEELNQSRRLLMNVHSRKLKYFGHLIRAENLSSSILHERINGHRAQWRQGDVELMASKTGQRRLQRNAYG